MSLLDGCNRMYTGVLGEHKGYPVLYVLVSRERLEYLRWNYDTKAMQKLSSPCTMFYLIYIMCQSPSLL